MHPAPDTSLELWEHPSSNPIAGRDRVEFRTVDFSVTADWLTRVPRESPLFRARQDRQLERQDMLSFSEDLEGELVVAVGVSVHPFHRYAVLVYFESLGAGGLVGRGVGVCQTTDVGVRHTWLEEVAGSIQFNQSEANGEIQIRFDVSAVPFPGFDRTHLFGQFRANTALGRSLPQWLREGGNVDPWWEGEYRTR